MEFKLKFAEFFPDIWNTLGGIPRTGWVKRGVKNPETDQEHTIACMKFVISIRDRLVEFSDSDIQNILDQLEIHEYPEWKDGDIPPVITDDAEEKKRQKALKFEREYNTMVELSKNNGNIGRKVFILWASFEAKRNDYYSFARQVDWYQSIEKAWEYQKNGENVKVADFINHYRNDITHKLLKEKMLLIEKFDECTRS